MTSIQSTAVRNDLAVKADRHLTDHYVNMRMLCALLAISPRTVSRLQANKHLNFPPPARIGRRRFWLKSEILEWMKHQK